MKLRPFLLFFVWFPCSDPHAFAWDQHQSIVNRILSVSSPADWPLLQRSVPVPCREEEIRERDGLAERIQVRAEAIPVFSNWKCGPSSKKEVPVAELLAAGFVDEPDLGMDQNLPESADPNGYRKWMGGVEGPTSQGFRHMVFPGMEWLSPLQTFQVPVSRIGDAFSRIDLLGGEIERARTESRPFWALRIALWREHLIQDLHQPFHTTQVPSLRMVPWSALFSGLVKKTTHAIANYHYAYEGLVLEWIKASGTETDPCFTPSGSSAYSGEAGFSPLPRKRAPVLGAALHAVLGDTMKSSEVDLPRGKGSIDYYLLLHAAKTALSEAELDRLSKPERTAWRRAREMVSAMEEVKALTCELMREAVSGFRINLEASLQGALSSNSSKTGR